MMRHVALAIVLAGCFVSSAYAQIQTYGDHNQQNQQEDTAVRQRYNSMENRWETTRGQKVMKYNSMEGEWSYQDQNAVPTYNSMEGKWEYPR